MELFIRQSSFWGSLLFIVIQIAQVVIAVIPGSFMTCLAGVVFFGPWYGFLYSAVGIIIGSCINFYLARRYGEKFIRLFVSDETYEKTKKKFLTGKNFDVVFTAAILLPCAPDDVLCMLAGLTDMSWRKFLTILFLGRPGYDRSCLQSGEVPCYQCCCGRRKINKDIRQWAGSAAGYFMLFYRFCSIDSGQPVVYTEKEISQRRKDKGDRRWV